MFIKDNKAVIEKMEELCSVLLEQEAYVELKQMLDRFATDETAIKQYEQVAELGDALSHKEQQGIALTEEEVEHYQREEHSLYDNDLIRKYMFARRELDNLQSLLDQYFYKTVELGRLPSPNELKRPTRGCGSHK